MPPDEYVKALEKALADLEDRVQRRDLLNAEIAGLRETVRVLSNRVAIAPDRQQKVAQLLAMVDCATPSLTDSIRGLLTQIHPKAATAIEVRNALEEKGFNFDDFSNSLSACHAALKRLLTDNEVELGLEVYGKPAYRRVLPEVPARRRTWADPAVRKRRVEALRGAWADPEVRKRMSERNRKRRDCADPE